MNNNINKPANDKMRFKFNLNYFYLLILLMIGILWFTNLNSSSSKEIPYNEFRSYVQQGYISRIIGYDDNSVEAYIKAQHVKDVFGSDSSRVGRNPMIATEAPSRESLENFLQEAQFDGSITYEKRGNYMGAIFWNLLPILFFIGFIAAIGHIDGGITQLAELTYVGGIVQRGDRFPGLKLV